MGYFFKNKNCLKAYGLRGMQRKIIPQVHVNLIKTDSCVYKFDRSEAVTSGYLQRGETTDRHFKWMT